MEFIESERGNQKLNIKLKKNCGGQLSGGLLSCSPHFTIFSNDDLASKIQVLGKHLSEEAMQDV
jgi:hypothetical protein